MLDAFADAYFLYVHAKPLAFPRRDGDQHRAHARAYADLENPEERDEYFKMHSARYFELLRLPYFDLVRMTILDPMHNILLGKTLLSAI